MRTRFFIISLCWLGVVSPRTSAQDIVVPTIELKPETAEKALQVLRAGLKSKEFWPSIHAAEGLTLAGHGDEVIAYLEPKLPKEKDDQKRCGLSRELVRAGKRKYAQVMLDILAGEDDYGHVHAAESLYKVNEIGDGKAMRAALQQTKNVKLRLMAAAALARKGDRKVLEFVRETLESGNAEDSRTAAWILGRVGTYKDVPALKARVGKAEEPLTKAYYQHALAALGDEDGLAALRKNLSHTDGAVRTYAATFAGDAQAVECKAELIEMLDDKHEDARIRAAQTLLFLSRSDR
jgi:sialidase-1